MSRRYLLDTNILSDLIRRPSGADARRIEVVGAEVVCTSIVVACELRYGALNKGSARLGTRVAQLLAALDVLPLEPGVDVHYGAIRHAMERAGSPIGANDLLIAAHARALGATLVTDTTRELSRAPDLAVENWLEPN